MHIVNDTRRIESFSDGVFALAITLLVLELNVPHLPGAYRMGLALAGLWPSYFAYALSFLMIGIYWANHHYIFNLYKRSDHVFALLNVLFLMCISFLPFPTAVLAGYMNDINHQYAAVTYYALGLLLPAFSWLLVWWYASARYRLIDTNLQQAFVKFLTLQYLLSVVLYLVALLVSLWNANVGLSICVGLTLLYLLPPKKPVYQNS